MSVQAIIERRKFAIITDFCINPLPPLIQVESAKALGSLIFLAEFQDDERDVRLGRRSTGSVLLRKGSGNPDSGATLWVAASYKGYRGAYLAFLRKAYGIDPSTRDLAGYDVDHLLNRARSAAQSSFLRIEAIESGANRAWGSLFERMASTPKISKNSSERRLMSYAVAAKVMGLRPPSGPDDTQGIDQIADALATRGMNRKEVQDGLKNILAHIERNQ